MIGGIYFEWIGGIAFFGFGLILWFILDSFTWYWEEVKPKWAIAYVCAPLVCMPFFYTVGSECLAILSGGIFALMTLFSKAFGGIERFHDDWRDD